MYRPAFEYVASTPSIPTAATAITPGYAAGNVGNWSSRPLLPADATIKTPALTAAATASLIAGSLPPPPRLMLTIGALVVCTSAPSFPGAGNPAAYNRPCAMSKNDPEPVMSRTRTGLIFALQFTPAEPMFRLPTAPMMPDVHSP